MLKVKELIQILNGLDSEGIITMEAESGMAVFRVNGIELFTED